MKIWLCILTLFCWANLACAQAPVEYPDVPLSDPAYKELQIFYKAGIFTESAHDRGRLLTRYEFAVPLQRILESIHMQAANRDAFTVISAERINLLRKSPDAIAALARLVAQFTPELQLLGFSQTQLESIQKELAAGRVSTPAPVTSSPFPDVPKNHWAFDAVERLRQSGIVVGYPANVFSQHSTK